jgi:hypothetical protein
MLLQTAAAAQPGGPPPGGGDRNLRDSMSDIKGRSNEIERVKREGGKPASNPEERFPQIKEDYERIQIVNSEVLQAGAPGEAKDYGRVSEAASEIKKRATRLKSNLFAADSEKQSKEKGQDAEEPRDLKALLAALDSALNSFIGNPIFQNTKVVDPEDSLKARQDLEKVIKLSARVGKEADKLKKAGGS